MSHPLRNVEMVGRGWNPWRALRERRHLRLVFAELPPATGRGAIVDVGDGQREVLLDYRLGRVDRNAVLAHELVHDERGLLYPPGTPPGIVQKEEVFVNREVARRLVPIDELDVFVDRVVDAGEPVHAAAVMDEFDVPLDVAQRSLWLLGQQRRMQ